MSSNRIFKVLLDLPSIIEEAKEKRDLLLEPNRSVYDFANELIVKFIRDRDLIIYGGTALHKVLVKESGSGIYKPDTLFDYDFYSPNFIEDANDLADILALNGMRNIRVISGFQITTRKVFVDYERDAVADITYVNLELFSRLPTITIDGIRYISPYYAKADIYKMLSYNIFHDNFRFLKSWNRINLIEKVFPPKKELRASIDPGSFNVPNDLYKDLIVIQGHVPIILAAYPSKLFKHFKGHKAIDYGELRGLDMTKSGKLQFILFYCNTACCVSLKDNAKDICPSRLLALYYYHTLYHEYKYNNRKTHGTSDLPEFYESLIYKNKDIKLDDLVASEIFFRKDSEEPAYGLSTTLRIPNYYVENDRASKTKYALELTPREFDTDSIN